MLDECNRILEALLGNERLIPLWWNTQNRAFQFKTPKEVFDTDSQRVIDYLNGMLNSDSS